MRHTFLCVLLLTLLDTLLYCGHAQDAVLTTDPYWSPLFTGESVTFICDMKEGGVTDWDYKFNKDGGEFTPYNIDQRYTLNSLSPGHSGEYQCCGSHKRSRQTKCSKIVTLTVSASDKPKATLTSGPTTIPVGGRVTLTCSVEPSAGWKYEWFRRSTDTSEVQAINDGGNGVISVSQGGIYWCIGGRGRRGEPVYYTDHSDPVTIEIIISNKTVVTRQHNWPQIFRGEKITLTCEVQGGEDTEWKYEWRKPRSSTHWTDNKYWTFTASESSSGDYMCRSRLRDDSYSSQSGCLSVRTTESVLDVRMGQTFLSVLLLTLTSVFLYCGHAQDAVLTTNPYWSPLFIGESVTFTCDMKEGGDTDWDYKFNRSDQQVLAYETQVYRLNRLSTNDSGEYQCCGRHRISNDTKCSNTVSLTVSDKPRATLTSGPTTIPVGGRVTLTCSVEPSAGWKYEWFKRSTDTSEYQVRTNDGENRFISVSQAGIYRCRGGRGGRGESVYYTYHSDPVTIEIIISNKAVVTRQHNWPQIFRGENITLTCEVQGGEDTEWIYGWKSPWSSIQWTNNKNWTFTVYVPRGGDYNCKGRRRDDSYSSTEWSKAITFSVSFVVLYTCT
ncbi:uncharacterized protein LOC125012972 [Mugil cephalus]|uniref:uncharacterized protein LOC125012972 n=1 Tax=Mugil cephalus TaxID=48193 RepID=UPI001FB58BF6|nr:uncharacterized protein LOC125012972 [Mugil cephalus]